MRLTIRSGSVRVGNVELHETFQITELDAGHLEGIKDTSPLPKGNCNPHSDKKSAAFSHDDLHHIESQLAIVIPCMNEQTHLLEGVLRGVSNACLIILVSNSKKDDTDSCKFQAERELLTTICSENKRPGIIVHQQDEGLAEAFADAGMPKLAEQIYDEQSEHKCALKIREGKGEAMMIGVALAKLAGKQFVGFIDADNWCSGSVQEYCKAYAAGLHYALHSAGSTKSASASETVEPLTEILSMVRINWNSKPKIEDDQLVRKDAGRCSLVVNEWMNRFLDAIAVDNIHEGLIQTGNAGEHAMSIDLAMQLHFATGYAVEPYQFVDMFEQFESLYPAGSWSLSNSSVRDQLTDSWDGLASPMDSSHSSMPSPQATWFLPKVRVIQVKTCGPHIHDFTKGDEHIEKMQIQGLSAIYHSHLVTQEFKDELLSYLRDNFPAAFGSDGEPNQILVYPALGIMDLSALRSGLKAHARTLEVVGALSTILFEEVVGGGD